MAGWLAGGLVGRSVGWFGGARCVGCQRAVARRGCGGAALRASLPRGGGGSGCGSEWVTRRRPRPRHARARECWRSYLVGVVVAARAPKRFRVVVVGGGRGTAARRCALPAALAPRAASARAAPPPERSPPVSDALQ
eukprot:scaffold1636_cov239-Prasinococcus_capsulatus_cf.AAC.4